MLIETTSNGIEYSYTLAGPEGADFILYPTALHSKNAINAAKLELKNSRDVVNLKIANRIDIIDRYKSEIFRDPRLKKLKWYEIKSDDITLYNSYFIHRMNVNEYVEQIVLPNIELAKKENIKNFPYKKIMNNYIKQVRELIENSKEYNNKSKIEDQQIKLYFLESLTIKEAYNKIVW